MLSVPGGFASEFDRPDRPLPIDSRDPGRFTGTIEPVHLSIGPVGKPWGDFGSDRVPTPRPAGVSQPLTTVYPVKRLLREAMPPVRPLRITRFTVMATLQAARARKLGLTESSAHSWGLNRAIFYAAAKRGFGGRRRAGESGEPGIGPAPENLYSLGNDEAYRDPNSEELLFTIGGETQTEEKFRQQVAVRFGSDANFHHAWNEAMETVGAFDDEVLRSGSLFYSQVYKPIRDELVAKWSQEFLGIVPPGPAARPAGKRIRRTLDSEPRS